MSAQPTPATGPTLVREDASREYWFDEGCHILEWSNGAHDEAASIARATVPPGGTTRWHRLVGIVERYLVLSGRGRVELEGVAPAEVGPGDVVVIPAGCAQRIAALGSEPLVFAAICTPRFRADAYRDAEPGPG